MSTIHDILKKHWGYDQFRPLQEDIILSVLNGNDTLALLPTGGGKSICFQVPAMAMPGLCLVISPLIALMKDQVENLRRRKIKAAAIYSGMSQSEIESVVSNILFDPTYKFLYVSPERLKTDLFKLNFERMNISLIAVDEAHCISQWGYDFRPPYLEIAEIRPYFPKTPIIALTATATPEVVKDIQHQLLFQKENVFRKSFYRENLTYYVVKEEDKYHRMLRVIHAHPGTGIIYARNRRRTKEIADFLCKEGISADFYHAGLDTLTRDKKQQEWMSGKTRVIVSTNAFGMGIDKPDVRFVIHLDIPDTLEAYFQEAGRGGRDEQPSVAVMLYDNHDLRELHENFEYSFPPLETIRKVYHEIASACQIPFGSGAGTEHPFAPIEFAQKLGMKPVLFFNALSFLEKTGIIFLSDEVKKSSLLHVCCDKNSLENFYTQHPKSEDFVKLLLRSYSGLFTGYIKIDEAEIARRAGISKEEVIALLKKLQQLQLINYQPSLGKSTIIFTENRVPEDYLYFSPDIYKNRKTVAKKRLESVIHFVEDKTTCRSRSLLSYFGETKSSDCGRCDVCRRIHRAEVTKNEYNEIASAIEALHKNNITDLHEVFSILAQKHEEEKITKVIRWMRDNEKLKS